MDVIYNPKHEKMENSHSKNQHQFNTKLPAVFWSKKNRRPLSFSLPPLPLCPCLKGVEGSELRNASTRL